MGKGEGKGEGKGANRPQLRWQCMVWQNTHRHAPRARAPRPAAARASAPPYMGGINHTWTARRMCTGQGDDFFDKDSAICKCFCPPCTVITHEGMGA